MPAWLDSAQPADALWPALAGRDCNPFNLVAADLVQGCWWWVDDGAPQPRPLGPGVHGLSNAALGTPWPKVRRLEGAMKTALSDADDEEALSANLFDALADRWQPVDEELPDTGVGLARERFLSPAFIGSPDGRYGTRCSTVLIGERQGARWRIRLTERSFDPRGRAVEERTVRLDGWPAAATPPVQVRPLR